MSSSKLNNTCNKQLTVIPPSPQCTTNIILKADSGATKTYIKPTDQHVLTYAQAVRSPSTVKLPDNTHLHQIAVGQLPLHPTLSPQAQQGHVLKGLNNSSLLSIGQLCDDDCIAVFDKRALNIYKHQNLIIRGTRNWTDGLWDVHVKHKPNSQANIIVRKDTTKHNLAEYLHKCAFSPALSTFQRAIKQGHFLSWPGISEINFSKCVTNITPTAKGHLDQERANLQSTHKIDDTAEDFVPTPTSTKTYANAAKIYKAKPKETTYSDQTGRFPYRSSRGNEYIMVMYDYDSNAILATPLKNRQAKTIADAWELLHNRLTSHGHPTKNFLLDNECSLDLKQALTKNKKQYELTPPNIHRRNAAERAIRTFKNHCMAGFASCDKDFPLAEWDRLLVQAELTLNLLRTSRVNPKLSAYAYLFGNFDFNKTPLAPPGTKVIIHRKAKVRGSWDYHGVEGWYVGPSLEHYRCLKCYNPDTYSEVDTDTVQLLPNVTPIPVYTDVDAIDKAINDIVHILNNPAKSNIPTILKGDEIKRAFADIATILHNNKTTKLPAKPIKPTIIPSPRVQGNATPMAKTHTPPPRVQRAPRVIPLTKTTGALPRVQPVLRSTESPSPTSSPKQNASQPPPTHPLPRPVTPPPTTNTSSFQQFLTAPLSVPQIIVARSPFPRFRTQTPIQQTTDHLFQMPRTLTQYQQFSNHIFDEAGKKLNLDALLKGPRKNIWQQAVTNELGRLSSGIPGKIKGTKAMRYIHKNEVPTGKKITYANMVCNFRPLKNEKHRVRLTIGGDKLDYDRDTASPTANLIDTKILLNSTISDSKKGAQFMSLDIKDFFLMSPLPVGDREYMRIHSKYFSDEYKTLNNLHDKINKDGYIYCEILLGMYGLKQAAILAYKQLRQRLEPAGYFPIKESNGLWAHRTRRTIFALCVDDFGIKYFSKDDADHLVSTLKNHYDITIDWEGRNYCGLTLDWNYDKGYVDVSMPGYVHQALNKFQHTKPTRVQHSPHRWNAPVFGRKIQYTKEADKSPPLNKKGTRLVQSIVGKFLYYARALENPILVALNEIGTQQAAPTENTMKEATWMMDFLAHHPDAKIRYFAGNMQLSVDSDAAYLVIPDAKSRYAGHFYLESLPNRLNYNGAPHNAPIHTECKIIPNVVCSAAEAECGGLFYNAQMALTFRRTLEAIGHPQRPTRIKTDNKTANSFVHASMRIKRSKTWDMRYHWLRENTTKKLLDIYWDKGSNNNADYHTKHHAPAVHKVQRPRYILKGFSITDIARSICNNNFLARVCSSCT